MAGGAVSIAAAISPARSIGDVDDIDGPVAAAVAFAAQAR